jgi:hypothetical protein
VHIPPCVKNKDQVLVLDKIDLVKPLTYVWLFVTDIEAMYSTIEIKHFIVVMMLWFLNLFNIRELLPVEFTLNTRLSDVKLL